MSMQEPNTKFSFLQSGEQPPDYLRDGVGVTANNVHTMPAVVPLTATSQQPEDTIIKTPTPSSPVQQIADVQSFIASGDEFIGDINCKGGVRVCGTIRGDVNCSNGTVYIDHGGLITGNIESTADVIIDGNVGAAKKEGSDTMAKISTPGKITLMNRCIVNANVFYGKLTAEDDMTLNGSAQRITKTPN